MLVNGHLTVEMATPSALQGYLPDKPAHVAMIWEDSTGEDQTLGRVDTYHPLGQWTTATTAERPAIIYDDGASTCSPVISIDRRGNAFHFHEAFGLYLNRELLYYEALPEVIATDGVVSAITATNKFPTPEGEADPNYIDRIVDSVEAGIRSNYPKVTFLPLISKRYPNQNQVHELVPPDTYPCGFVFIPGYIAPDQVNHLLVVPSESRRELRELIPGVPKYVS